MTTTSNRAASVVDTDTFTVRRTIEIAAPAEKVWAIVSDLKRMGEWSPQCKMMRVSGPVGHGTKSVEAGYMANAWVRVRHHDYDTARAVLDDIGQTIRMHAR